VAKCVVGERTVSHHLIHLAAMNAVELALYLLLTSLHILIRNCKNTSTGVSCIGMKKIG
jgi:hypothetical protein